MSNSSSESRPPMDKAEAMAEFRKRHRLLIAKQGRGGGMAFAMLRKAQTELGLSDAEAEAAIGSATATPRAESSPPSQRELDESTRKILNGPKALRKFRRAVKNTLKRVDVVTPKVERQLREAGVGKYGLSPEVAADAVEAAISATGRNVIQATDAIERIMAHARLLLTDRRALSPGDLDRLSKYGASWGLAEAEVNAAIRQAMAEESASHSRTKAVWVFAIGLIAVAVLAAMLTVGYIALNQALQRSSSTVEASAPVDAERQPAAPPDSLDTIAPEWRAAIEASRVELSSPENTAIFDDLSAPSRSQRAEAWDRVALRWGQMLKDDKDEPALASLLALGMAREPSFANSERVRNAVLGRLDGLKPDSPPPSSLADYRAGFVALKAVLKALDLKPETARAEPLRQGLEDRLGSAVAAQPSATETELAVLERAYQRFHEPIQRALADDTRGPLALELQLALRHSAKEIGPRSAAKIRADRDFLLAAFKARPEDWEKLKPLCLELIATGDPDALDPLIEYYEHCDDKALCDELERTLADSAKLKDIPESRVELIDALKSWAKKESYRTKGGRPRRLLDWTEALLAQPAKTDRERLEQTLTFAHGSMLGAALYAQGEGLAEFDQKIETPPKLTSEPEIEAPPPPSPKPAEELRDLLAKPIRGDINDRRAIIAILEQAADETQFSAEEARDVVRLLLSASNAADRLSLLGAMSRLTKFRSVQLALADAMLISSVKREQASALVSSILGTPVQYEANDAAWRENARLALLTHVLKGSDVPFDDAAAKLLTICRDSARLLGVEPDRVAQASQPSQALELMIQGLADRLGSKASAPADRAELDAIQAESAANRAAGDGDIQRFALQLRTFARLLVLTATLERPDRAEAARALHRDLLKRDAKAAGLLEQLRDGQEQVLRLWRLIVAPHDPEPK